MKMNLFLFFKNFFVFFYLNTFFLIFKFLFLRLTFKNKKIIIFDIDNTIANTWPSLLMSFKTEKDRLISLPRFEKVLNLAQDHILANEKVIFLTARDYKLYSITLKWLLNIGISKPNLIMVSKPYEKIKLLRSIPNKRIILYDDLSYNHENGYVKFYDKEILLISQMKNVEYLDYNYLIKLHD